MCYDVKCYRRASTNIVNLVLTTYYGKNSQYFSKMVSVWTKTQIKCDVFRTERGILSNQEKCLFFPIFILMRLSWSACTLDMIWITFFLCSPNYMPVSLSLLAVSVSWCFGRWKPNYKCSPNQIVSVYLGCVFVLLFI